MKTTILNYLRTNTVPIKRTDLARMFGVSVRELRMITAELVSEGFPILSSDDGLYYTTDIEQIDRVASRYYSMGINTIKRAEALKKTAQKLREAKAEQLRLAI